MSFKKMIKSSIVPLILLSLLVQSGCKKTDSTSSNSNSAMPKGTLQMIDSLNAIYARTDFMMHPYEKDFTMNKFREMIKNNASVDANQIYLMALEFVRGGDTQQGIDLIGRLFRAFPDLAKINEQTKPVHDLLAIAYLRQGEVNNCISNHNEQSCLFPIQGKGIHTNPSGSELSIKQLSLILEVFPNDLQSRYLLNLAYMTLGQYPSKVPTKYLIPPASFASEIPFKKFNNIARLLGLDLNNLSGSVVTEDFDNDGFIDIMTSPWNMQGTVKYFKNMGNGKYEDQTDDALLTGLAGGLNMQHTDYNNDGFVDVLILRGAWKSKSSWGISPNSLLKNNGDGTFQDATIAAGLYSTNPTQTAAWFDYDNDGNLDVFIGNETNPGFPDVFSCEFYHNNGDGSFTNYAQQYGMTVQMMVKGVTAGDVNNDGLIDLYVSILNGPNRLYMNKGGSDANNWKFEEQAALAGVQAPFFSFPAWFFDFNNDGYEDIFAGAYDTTAIKSMAAETTADWLKLPFRAEVGRLYMNNKNGSFTDVTKAFGLNHPLQTMGCNYGDVNNDGYLDFYLGTGSPDLSSVVPNKLYVNEKGKRYRDVTTASDMGNVQKGHAISMADLDNDGDLDIYAEMGGAFPGDMAPNCLFENPGFGNNFVILKLVGKTVNRAAIGAVVKIEMTDSQGNKQITYNKVSSGASFGSNSLQIEAGLGKANKIDLVEVTWPNKNRSKQVFTGISVNKKYQLEEGQENAKELSYSKIKFIGDGTMHNHDHQAM